MKTLQKILFLNTSAVSNIIFLIKTRLLPLSLLLCIIGVVSITEAIGISSIYPVIDIMQNAEKINFYEDKINSILPFSIKESNIFLFIIIGIILIFLFKNTLIIFTNYAQARVSNNLQADWKNRILKIYLAKPYSFFINNSSGDLLHRMMSQTSSAGGAIVKILQILKLQFTFLSIYITMCIISLKITLIVTLVIAITITVFFVISKQIVLRKGKLINKLGQQSYSLASETISGIRQIKMFASEPHFSKKFISTNIQLAKISSTNSTLTTLPAPTIELLAVTGLLSAFYFISKIMGQGNIMPTLAVFVGCLYKLFPTVSGISASAMALSSQLPCISTVADLLCQQEENTNIFNDVPKESFKKHIQVKNVTFEYKKNIPVLQNVNIHFKKGEFYGIVGPSGSGKSTLVDLLIGFYSPLNGKILIDDKELQELEIQGWRKNIGVISQETFIFNGTAAENISFALDGEKKNTEKIIEAAKLADAHEFISKLPDGYETFLGEKGMKLSGGQRQRLAIARALYRDPAILVFDEATSSLDAISEKKIQSSIEMLSQEKTVIAIAHRLSTIINADYIYVMQEGKVIEEGKHLDLIAMNNLYTSLCKKQGLSI